MLSGPYSRAELRNLINKQFRTDEDLDRFIIDYFKEYAQHIVSRRNRTEKLNDLFMQVDTPLIDDAFEQARRDAGGLPVVEAQDPILPSPSAHSGHAYQSQSYVTRALEEQAVSGMLDRNLLIYIRAPRGFGKTWLIQHLLATLSSRYRTIYTSLAEVQDLGEKDQWAHYLLNRLQDRFPLPAPSKSGPLLRVDVKRTGREQVESYLKKLCAAEGRPLLLAIDGLDHIVGLPVIEEEVARTLRSWSDHSPANKGRLVLVTASTKPPTCFALEMRTSPFNVQNTVTMQGLSRPQVMELADKLQTPISASDASQIDHWLGGNPLLISHLFSESQTRRTSPLMLLTEATDRRSERCGIFEEHLRLLDQVLGEEMNAPLRKSFLDLAQNPYAGANVDSQHKGLLEDLGLICRDVIEVVDPTSGKPYKTLLRCQLYMRIAQRAQSRHRGRSRR